MRRFLHALLGAAVLLAATLSVQARPALEVLGRDFSFPNRIEGLPAKLSDFKGLQINDFVTSDGVRLAYWEAGQGRPLVFIPGWSANGAEYLNVMYLLSRHYRVIVLDPRNQGLSQQVAYGNRIARYAVDLRELGEHLGLASADYCGWSMGASVLWSYIDLFGTRGIRKVAFVDEPASIYSHADWSEQERLEAGGMTSSPERMIESFTTGKPVTSLICQSRALERYLAMDSPSFQNSEAFAREFIKSDPGYMKLVLFDHISNDWRDVLRSKIKVPTAIFTGENSDVVACQKWMKSVIPDSRLYLYSKAEHGDHFLMFKNPLKFTEDLRGFLEQ
ncbi:alpha/beta fold hydrolase [Holophaga foetida]|uniref:alpha/beta fold hydrolase n=1 Tax=Holophaga foetida TaxID=35839 RepID=UPI0002471803|nr:alpha/beta hydrolase [Holophaga foetida]